MKQPAGRWVKLVRRLRRALRRSSGVRLTAPQLCMVMELIERVRGTDEHVEAAARQLDQDDHDFRASRPCPGGGW